MVLRQRIEHHEQLLGTLLRRRVSEPGVQVLTRGSRPTARRCPHEDPARRRSEPGMPERHPTFRGAALSYIGHNSAASGLKNRKNENFDPLLPGVYDWGSWWQEKLWAGTSSRTPPEVAADPRARDAA
jgi:hypothetical protein